LNIFLYIANYLADNFSNNFEVSESNCLLDVKLLYFVYFDNWFGWYVVYGVLKMLINDNLLPLIICQNVESIINI